MSVYRTASPLPTEAPPKRERWTWGDVGLAVAYGLVGVTVLACAWIAPMHARNIATCEKRGGTVRGFVIPGRYTTYSQECKGATP